MRGGGEQVAFTIAAHASDDDVAVICSAVLATLWPTLEWLEIDLTGLEDIPGLKSHVMTLEAKRPTGWLRRRLSRSAHLVPGEDDDLLPAVLPVLPWTLGSTGLSRDGVLVFNADDSGDSCVFELTATQIESLRGSLRAAGVDPGLLIHL